MITPILILSSIFIAIAFIVNENNAKYLLSGYNTMSEEEKMKFDIKSYIPFFRNFHIFLGLSLLIISLILLYFVNPNWSGIFLVAYPLLAYMYFIWKGIRFSRNKAQKRVTYFVIFGLFLLLLFIVFDFKNTLKDNQIKFKNNKVEIAGEYGTELSLKDIKSISLVEKTPEITRKINGFALETIKKGFFKTRSGEKIKLLINSSKTPLILIITKDNQKIYYSSKDKNNDEIYKELKSKIIEE